METEIRKLVHERMVLLFDAWMTQIGHKRPGVAGGPGAKPGLPLAQADAKAAELTQQIQKLMGGNGTTFWVAPTGNDDGPGTQEQPFATFNRAQQAARSASKPATVLIRGGTYYLVRPLVLTADDSETTFSGAPGEEVVISGGFALNLIWARFTNRIMQAKIPAGLTTDQLFVNGERMPMARYPNFDPSQRIYNGTARDAFSRERVARWADPDGRLSFTRCTTRFGATCTGGLPAKTPTARDAMKAAGRTTGPRRRTQQFRFVENILEELDAPGEWFHDAKTAHAVFYPPPGLDLKTATVEVVAACAT